MSFIPAIDQHSLPAALAANPGALCPLPAIRFTANQIEWAKTHDWFVGVVPSGKIVCKDEYTKDGVFYRDVASFSDMRSLRDRAGY